MSFEERIGENYRTDWNTPQNIVDLLLQFGPVDLDPCSNHTSIVPARRRYILKDGQDGLVESSGWGDGLVYVNPPYGREIREWSNRIIWEAFLGCEIIALVPARTDTQWFQKMYAEADCVLFWSGRLKFGGARDPAKFPSAIFYFGRRRERFERVFGSFGVISSAAKISTSTRPPF